MVFGPDRHWGRAAEIALGFLKNDKFYDSDADSIVGTNYTNLGGF